jgi:hypothetical protein
MPIDVEWDNAEKTIVRQTYGREVTYNDYYDGVKKRFELISSVEHPVDLIIDLRGANPNLKGLVSAGRYASRHVPPNQRFVLLVGANLFIRSLVNTFIKILPKVSDKIYFVATLEEARKFLQEKNSQTNSSDS